MKRYFTLMRCGILESLQFRLSMLFTVVGNLLHLLLLFYLWKAIYASVDTDVVNGLTFQDTMIYLVFANALFNFMEMWIVWDMGRSIQSGEIVVDLLRPMNYISWRFFMGCGETVVKFLTTFLPTAIVVYFVTKGAISLGWNILWFAVSVIFSMLINYFINFCVGVVCMYTNSIWGMNIFKEVVISLLSGATVPLAFFPEHLKKIAMVLPFQGICNAPMNLLLHADYAITDCMQILGFQLVWVILLAIFTNVFFRISIKRITVNGG